MKPLFLFAFLLSIKLIAQNEINPELKKYVDFLQNQKFSSAKEYIIDKFKTKDIVIFSERDHRDITQYEIIFSVLKDATFKGNVYTEVGCSNNYKVINEFLVKSDLTDFEKENELLRIYRDMDFNVVWEKYNFYMLLDTIFEINRLRNKSEKILLFPLDVEFEWDKVTNPIAYKVFDDYLNSNTIDRDYEMGKNFVRFYEQMKTINPERKKAIVILNTYHGYIRIPKYKPLPTTPEIYSAGEFIYKSYPNITTNIYINGYKNSFDGNLSNNGIMDAAFSYTKIDNIGFDLNNTPFGNSEFDLYNFGETYYEDVNFDYIFDGMLFYKPLTEIVLVTGIPNIYPKELEKQFYERNAIVDNTDYEQSLNDNKEYLIEVNTKKEYKLDDELLKKINEQIEYWLKIK